MRKAIAFGVLLCVAAWTPVGAQNLLLNGDFATGTATNWSQYQEDWGGNQYWNITSTGPTPPEGETSRNGGGAACWYQVVEVPAGTLVKVDGQWKGDMYGGSWWGEIMLFSFSDANQTLIDAAIDDPGTVTGSGGVGGMAFKKDAWGLNQTGGTWDWEAIGLSPLGDEAITSLGDVVVVLKHGGGGAGTDPLSKIWFDNLSLTPIAWPNRLVNGDFATGDETGWSQYQEDWGGNQYWNITSTGPTPPEGETSRNGGGAACWYQVVEVPAGTLVKVDGQWKGDMYGGSWWGEIMLFSFSDANQTLIDAAIDDPGTVTGSGGVGGMAFKKDAWGLNQTGGTWDWEAIGLSPLGDEAITSLGDVVVVLKHGGGGAGTDPLSKIWFDNLSLLGLPFWDDFESYPDNSTLADQGQMGWSGNTNATVELGVGVQSTQGAQLPDGSAVTNSAGAGTTITKVWTDFHLKPVQRDPDPDVNSNVSVMAYVNTDGYVVLYNDDNASPGWVVCSNNVCGDPVTPLVSTDFARISLHQNYDDGKVAAFVDGVLLREELPLIGDATSYEYVAVQSSGDTNAYLDNLLVTTEAPPDMENDCDDDGWADADEIQAYGSISATINGIPMTWYGDNGLDVDPDGDADSDGVSNQGEYVAGTNPDDMGDVFMVLDEWVVGDTNYVEFMGNTQPTINDDYIMERASDLVVGDWGEVGTVSRDASGTNLYFEVNTGLGSPVFYRPKAVMTY